MNENDMILGGGIPNIGGPKIDPRDYSTIRCKKCGHIVFHSGVILKEIPGTVVGQGADPVIVPLSTFVCDKCGEILESDIKAYKLEHDVNNKIET